MTDLVAEISKCRLCADRFAATATRHVPRPVPWFKPGAKVLISGQAPGMRVYEAGKPFFDRSGDRLRDWLGVSEDDFYDKDKFAVVPMAFCFPGYNAKGSDLPPPKICAQTWHDNVMQSLRPMSLTVLIGAYAHQWHLGGKMSVTDRVAAWRECAPHVFPLPHPSWRNTGWIKRNPWFESELIPALQKRVKEELND